MKFLFEYCNASIITTTNDGLSPLHWASLNGHFEIVKYLHEKCRAYVDLMDNSGNTSLYYATMYNHFDIIVFLVGKCKARITNKIINAVKNEVIESYLLSNLP